MKLANYNDFKNYFGNNKMQILKQHKNLHKDFKIIFDKILKICATPQQRPKNIAVSYAILLRATKYLFVIHRLTLEGHVEEARILKRSIIELIIWGYLIKTNNEVFNLWEKCFKLRLENTDANGVVNLKNLSKKEFKISTIIKKYKADINKNSLVSPLIKVRGIFSTLYAHENLLSITPRIEDRRSASLSKIEIYIGQDAKSKNDRVKNWLEDDIKFLQIIEQLI